MHSVRLHRDFVTAAPEHPVQTREAAAFLGICAKTAQNWAREGRIPAHPAGNSFRNRWLFFISEQSFPIEE
jgi:excisionase family DNA binding protein